METFCDYAYYYNTFYADKDYDGEAKIVYDLISKFAVGGHKKSILNLGCGTGKHDYSLIRRGYNVHGLDLSAEMIKIAKESINDRRRTYEVADIRDFKVSSKYDIAISLFHVMSYQSNNEDIKNVLTCVNNALNVNGIFIFDVWYGPGVLTDRPVVRVKRVEDCKNYFVRIAEPVLYPNENTVDVKYSVNVINKSTGTVKSFREIHKMRYYFKPELEEMMLNYGFELLDCIDCVTLQRPDFNSWTVYFVVKKHVD